MVAIEDGRFFTHEEAEYAAKVCVLGQTVVANLFGADDPVGQTIRIQKIPCQVIGVLAVKGQSPMGQDQDDVVIMPFTTVQKKIKGAYWLDDIFCSAVSPAAIVTAEEEIAALLRQRHHVLPGQDDDFNLRHPADIGHARAESQRTMTLVLGRTCGRLWPASSHRSADDPVRVRGGRKDRLGQDPCRRRGRRPRVWRGAARIPGAPHSRSIVDERIMIDNAH